MSFKQLNVEKNTGYLFFRNPPLPQISTFSLGQKGCAYYEKSAYNEWAQYINKYMNFFIVGLGFKFIPIRKLEQVQKWP